ncbi:(2Fe-2S)-binding protein [Kitasatospora sp. SUK 42]|uniref:(2Fe-2S)-binding protein n=1 Tax=Kitasatospora sp. SUK 42 TaxID=1588882 RepID=UPI0018CA7B90|nr:(2Fe-2S)-binding protein [Kitasatospora sp. SUK 42]MBV2153411.1 (2Fe-2S)-binding protein [Kitasatospora sp. SUK 42]
MTASSTRPGSAPRAPRTTGAHSQAPAPDSPTPCASSYHRLTALTPTLTVRCAPPRGGDGWLPVAELVADPQAVEELVTHDTLQGLARYGRPLRPDVAAGFGLHRLVWPVSLLFTVPWFLERRVPLLGPGDVSVRRGPTAVELTVRPEAFACLPGDPAGGSPQARTAADGDALAAELRDALGGFLAPVLAAFGPRVRRGPRVLWAMATDAVVEGLWYAGGLLGEQERARAELSVLLAPPAPGTHTPGAHGTAAPTPAPFTPGAGFALPVPGRVGAPDTDRARASCCLVYTVEPEGMCTGCPRVTRR